MCTAFGQSQLECNFLEQTDCRKPWSLDEIRQRKGPVVLTQRRETAIALLLDNPDAYNGWGNKQPCRHKYLQLLSLAPPPL